MALVVMDEVEYSTGDVIEIVNEGGVGFRIDDKGRFAHGFAWWDDQTLIKQANKLLGQGAKFTVCNDREDRTDEIVGGRYLTQRDYTLLVMYYRGDTESAIAEALGISQPSIAEALKLAESCLRACNAAWGPPIPILRQLFAALGIEEVQPLRPKSKIYEEPLYPSPRITRSSLIVARLLDGQNPEWQVTQPMEEWQDYSRDRAARSARQVLNEVVSALRGCDHPIEVRLANGHTKAVCGRWMRSLADLIQSHRRKDDRCAVPGTKKPSDVARAVGPTDEWCGYQPHMHRAA